VLDALLDDLVTANHILAYHNVLDAFGHISVRHPERPDRYFLARSRGPAGIERADLIEFDLDSNPIDLGDRRPYAERQIHGRIYASRPDVNAVCHNHAPATIPFGASSDRLRPIFHMGSVIGKHVPVWDIAVEFQATNLLVTTPAMGDSLARKLADGRVVLMRGHGSTVATKGLRETVFTAVYLQKNAELATSARSFNDVRYLSDDEIELALELLTEPLSQDRAWDDWSMRVRSER
jgi:HCOMODA/2-hydroxy-3-carboxy-muconic semialdehyde decarboxylase